MARVVVSGTSPARGIGARANLSPIRFPMFPSLWSCAGYHGMRINMAWASEGFSSEVAGGPRWPIGPAAYDTGKGVPLGTPCEVDIYIYKYMCGWLV